VPIVTPITVELASNLTAPYKGPDSAAIADFNRIRESIREQTGFKIPGIRAREDPGLPAGRYVVGIEEVTRTADSIVAGHHFAKPSASEIEALGGEHPLVVDPVDGGPGVWLPEVAAAAMTQRWDATSYLSRRLEALLRQSMHILIGPEEVLERLEDSWASVARRIAADAVLLSAFTRTVQALLREEVSTVAWEWICSAFHAEWTRTPNVDRVVAALRQQPEIRAKLPANLSPLPLCRLGPRLEAALAGSLIPYGDSFLLGLEPRVLVALLSAVRNLSDGRPAALLTRDPLVRPYLRQAVAAEFPRLLVMAEAELDSSRPSTDVRIIELPDAGGQP
jgi:flagellar biosynthesis component FlhA